LRPPGPANGPRRRPGIINKYLFILRLAKFFSTSFFINKKNIYNVIYILYINKKGKKTRLRSCAVLFFPPQARKKLGEAKVKS
jgi:hypothetical protein